MQVLCGQCGYTIKIEDEDVGTDVLCPKCEHEIAVPRFDEIDEDVDDLDDSAIYDLEDEEEGFADQVKEAMSRKVQVVCGSCNRGLSVRSRLSGKNARCPACGVKIRIPFPDEEVEEAELEKQTAAQTQQTEQGAAAQVDDPRLETHASSERRLLEEHGNHTAGQERLAEPFVELRLEILGDRKDPLDFGRRQVGQRDQIPPGVFDNVGNTTGISAPNVLMVGLADLVARNVIAAEPSAHVFLQCLELAVGKTAFPNPARCVQQVNVCQIE